VVRSRVVIFVVAVDFVGPVFDLDRLHARAHSATADS
jgi:hypothetical protein